MTQLTNYATTRSIVQYIYNQEFLSFSSFQIKARIGVFRETLKFGYLWDNLYLGFQCKILRDPDIFHFKSVLLVSSHFSFHFSSSFVVVFGTTCNCYYRRHLLIGPNFGWRREEEWKS